jgi:outer membrane protein OmpA-like peptidoglycan-associated protein
MNVRLAVSRVHSGQLLLATLARAAAALALPAAAAQGSLLEITVGPHETEWLQIKELKVLLDGAPLPVTLPTTSADPAQPIYSGAVAPGGHRIDVHAGFTGDSDVFSYVEGYVFRMHDQLDIDAPAGEAVRMEFRVVKASGITVEWINRFRLALRASHHPSDRAAEVPEAPAAAAVRPVEAEVPAAAPVPAAPVERQPCALEPPHFAFGRHELDPAQRRSLDRFAECLAGNDDAVVLEGFTDPRGPSSYNERLGEKRANEAAQYLVQRGVARTRLTPRSFGKTRLVCTEPTRACNSRNRRVEAVTSRP